jgi:hypothetical protein
MHRGFSVSVFHGLLWFGQCDPGLFFGFAVFYCRGLLLRGAPFLWRRLAGKAPALEMWGIE